MQSTACDTCRDKFCPNKIEASWQDHEGNVKIIADCAPKRTFFMVQNLHNNILSLQKSFEQLRNELNGLKGALQPLLRGPPAETASKKCQFSPYVKDFYIDLPGHIEK